MTALLAQAKINLALVVGPRRSDGKHELVTVYQRIDLADRVELVAAAALEVEGFEPDTLVRSALARLAERAGVEPRWRVQIEKLIPVAAGLGGGSSDAAAALALANATLPEPLSEAELSQVARSIGADVPFFLTQGPQLGEAEGAELRSLALPQDYALLLLLPEGARKSSTAEVYRAFDERQGALDFERRRSMLIETLARLRCAPDLASLPPHDLASSPLSERLLALGAFRADVSGAGPVVYGLFEDRDGAASAAERLANVGVTWLAAPAW